MKRSIILAALAAITTLGVQAQSTTPQTNAPATTQTQPGNTANLPYSGLATYNVLDPNRVPQNVKTSFGTDYQGINGAKWESNNDVYRSTFMQNGKNMSVLYDKNGKMRETRTAMQMSDLPASVRTSLQGKEANLPYEVKVGNNTYYTATVGGKPSYYDANGKAVTMPKMK
ncbi:hypothetical protein [Salmonirosea aquatica]|uniref:Beta-lactamase-inhibitor-like PepSY-like domain-containing protein n=1 Tax=Salmonirosea aquatica TaxID=2654236 RepID=A0A7C9F9N5_9BACT|nr:hypothetical protein [Cytophagaceae bacterium SJW1-29]